MEISREGSWGRALDKLRGRFQRARPGLGHTGQFLITLAGVSIERILDTFFGWAVRALFGQTSTRDRFYLAALVASAAVWPLLWAGVAFPGFATHGISSWGARLVWLIVPLILALALPLAVGFAVTAKGRSSAGANEAWWRRALQGFPVTVALTGALLILLVSVPVMRLAALFRRERSGGVPLVTDVATYHQVAATTVAALNQHGFALRPAAPRRWVAAPTNLVGRLAGEAFRMFIPPDLEHYAAPQLELSFYPHGVMVRGRRREVSWAQGVIEEVVTHTDALQTEAPAAQTLERLIRRVWMVHDEIADNLPNRGRLLQMIDRIARRLGGLDIDFADWQVLYRQLIQVERAVRGQRQILEENSAFARIGAAEATHRATAWSDTRPNIMMGADETGEAAEAQLQEG